MLDVKKIQPFFISFPVAKEQFITHPIANIEVLDARPNKFCLGFIKNQDSNYTDKYDAKSIYKDMSLHFKKEFKEELQQAVARKASFVKDGFVFLFVIKEFWLYDNGILQTDEHTKQNNVNSCGLLLRSDIYLKRDENYIPLFKIDTSFITRKILKYSKDSLLQTASANICDKVNSFSISEVYKRATRTKSKEAIDSFYSQTIFPKFINKLDTSKQYIFKTFEDFKNGDCKIASIRMFSGKKATYYYEREKGETEYLMQDYAFYDKGYLFIKTKNNYSPAFINNKRIYALEPKSVILKSHSLSSPIPYYPDYPSSPSLVCGTLSLAAINSIHWQDKDNRSLQNVMLDMPTGNTY